MKHAVSSTGRMTWLSSRPDERLGDSQRHLERSAELSPPSDSEKVLQKAKRLFRVGKKNLKLKAVPTINMLIESR